MHDSSFTLPAFSFTLPARAQARLVAEGVRVVRGGRVVLDDVDLTVSPASRWGVIGENGRGKSTLLHVLTGASAPDAGTVRRVGTLGVADQDLPAGDDTVASVIDRELADVRAALRALDEGTRILADGGPAGPPTTWTPPG